MIKRKIKSNQIFWCIWMAEKRKHLVNINFYFDLATCMYCPSYSYANANLHRFPLHATRPSSLAGLARLLYNHVHAHLFHLVRLYITLILKSHLVWMPSCKTHEGRLQIEGWVYVFSNFEILPTLFPNVSFRWQSIFQVQCHCLCHLTSVKQQKETTNLGVWNPTKTIFKERSFHKPQRFQIFSKCAIGFAHVTFSPSHVSYPVYYQDKIASGPVHFLFYPKYVRKNCSGFCFCFYLIKELY